MTVGAWRSSQPSVLVVLAPLASSGAAGRPGQTAGAGQRRLRLHGRRAGRMVRSLVLSPRSGVVLSWAFGVWCMMLGAEDGCNHPQPLVLTAHSYVGGRLVFGRMGRVH